MLRNKQAKDKHTIIIGAYGSGKTITAIEMMGNRPYQIYPSNDIRIDDIYSYPKHHGVIIEDVHYKPMKDKILSLILINPNIILTSLNEKDVPKGIMNVCKRKRLGRVDHRQNKIKEVAPNCEKLVDLNKSVYDINFELMKNKNRDEVLKIVKHNKPPDIQILSWLLPNVDVRKITFADHVMRRWSLDYYYEILTYSLSGFHQGRPAFPKRNSYSPVPKICAKLGLKARDSYLVKSLLQDEQYKEWAIKKLDSNECKILNLKKPRKKTPRVYKTKTLGDF